MSELKNEICLHALITNLKHDHHDIRPYTIFQNKEMNIIDRPFETFRKWNITEQTTYIESIFLRCSLQPIVRFVGNDHTTIIDGYQRYITIINFCNNKLTLNDNGLKQLKFLVGKKFETLSDEEKDYFLKSEPINFIDYSYNNSDKKLTTDEEMEITRYLHILYNTGLKLEKEEFQKAQFSDDCISNKIREKLLTENNFLETLEKMKQFNGRTQRNKIDNILLNCRLLIASTYSNIYNYSYTKNIQSRIDENYYPNINNLDKNQIFLDFDLNIALINEKLLNTQKWQKYNILHTKPFLDATYWLISIIRKDNPSDLENFDFMKYLEYFADKEENEKIFEAYQSHYQKNIYNKYYAVSKYYSSISGFNMNKYFSENEPKKLYGTINSINELYKNHFSYKFNKTKISTLIEDIKNSNYNLRPYYQRQETMNISLASKIIESILLDITLPYILVYNNYNSKLVTEVVDGQQRLLSIIGFFDSYFYNENGEKEYSKKRKFPLKDLRIHYTLNDCQINSSKKPLSKYYQNKILNYNLIITSIDDNNNKSFSAVEHFIRLNKNASTIKENSYRMWSLICDSQILNYEKNITQKFQNTILPPINQKRSANMLTFKLASLIYFTDNEKNYKQNDFNNIKVTNMIKEFNKNKDISMFKDPEKISIMRLKVLNILDKVSEFYEKINILTTNNNKNIRELFEIKKYANVPLINYYYLFILLSSLKKEDVSHNAKNIYNLVHEFWVKYNNRTKEENVNNLVNYYFQKISIYNS